MAEAAHGKNHRIDRGRDSAATGGSGAAGGRAHRAQSGQAREAEEERGEQGEDGRGAAGAVGEGEGGEVMDDCEQSCKRGWVAIAEAFPTLVPHNVKET
jgi:hypothetical protein